MNKLKAGGIWHATYERDDKGIIKRLRLINKQGVSVVLDKDVCKEAMKFGALKIDNVALTKDGKLYTLDSLIAKYYESCKLLGCDPLEISLINGKYIITGIPKGSKNIQIPNFVSGISVSDFSRHAINTEIKDSSEDIAAIKYGVANIVKNLDAVKECEAKIENRVEDIHSEVVKINSEENKKELQNFLTNLMESENSDVKKLVGDIQNKVTKNGENILDIKQRVTEGFSEATAQYNDIIQKVAKKKSLLEVPKSAGFIVDSKFNMTASPEKYNAVIQRYGITDHIKYEHIGILKNMLEYLYAQYISIDRVLNTMNKDIIQGMNYMQDFSSSMGLIKEHMGGFFYKKSPLEVIDSVAETTAQMAGGTIGLLGDALRLADTNIVVVNRTKQVLNAPFNALNMILNKQEFVSRRRQLHKMDTLLSMDSELNAFFETVDKDIFTFLCEYKFGDRRGYQASQVPGGLLQMQYKDLLMLFYSNAQHKKDTSTHFDTATIQMIALAYICAHKIICGEISDGIAVEFGINRDIGCDIDELRMHYYDKSENERVLRCKEKYDKLLRHIMFTAMLTLGFEHKFAKTMVIDKLAESQARIIKFNTNLNTATAGLDNGTYLREGYSF